MSIDIVRISDRPDGVRRRTKCDVCDAILYDEPGTPYDHVGTTLLVANYCKVCAKVHGWDKIDIKDVRVYETRGDSIGNINALARVNISTNTIPPKDPP